MAKITDNRKKRKGAYVLASIAVIIIIGAVVIFFYFGANSAEKKEYASQIKQESQAFTDGLISELDQIETSGAAAGTSGGGVLSSETPPDSITDAEKQIIGEELSKLNDAGKQQKLQTLSAAYSKAFSAQKAEALSMAAGLIEQGKSDWAALKAKGENTATNKAKLASEYLAKSQAMEAQIDASFYALTAKMEKQLRAEGIDPDGIIAGYQAEYEKMKEQYKKEMMDKAMAAIKPR